ncbi:MAG: DUF3786 domain-containing protein [Bacillota bacterium]
MNKKRSYFNLDVTLKEAINIFSTLDPEEVAKNAGVELNREERTFILPFVDRTFKVNHPSGDIIAEDGSPASQYLAIIMLHYLTTADGTTLSNKWIDYRHLPGGHIYVEPFKKRAVTPFLKTFGEHPEKFQEAAKTLGGYPLSMNGIRMVIPVLPMVPICFVLWPGDEEISSSANVLFDESAPSYLPTEDYAHLPAIINKVMKAKAGL